MVKSLSSVFWIWVVVDVCCVWNEREEEEEEEEEKKKSNRDGAGYL